MSRYKFFSIFLLGLMFFSCSFAQKRQSSSASKPRNVVKINPFSFIGATFSPTYERAIGKKFSLQLNGNLFLMNKIPEKYAAKIWKNYGDSDPVVKINQPRFYGYSLTPEFRWYFLPGQSAPEGLYLGAYVRYFDYGATIDGTFRYNDPYPPYTTHRPTVAMKVNYYAIKAGAQVGYNWLIGDRVSLDMFLGANEGLNGVGFLLESDAIQDRYDELKSEIKAQINFPGILKPLEAPILNSIEKLLPAQNLSKVRAGTSFSIPGFRGGMTLGVAF